MSNIRLFGIRHHGPGSSRSLVQALNDWQPQAVLIEGLPEIPTVWPRSFDLKPPVAAVFYPDTDPTRAIFAPMAEFSPEWVAMHWAWDHRAKLEFIDMPAAMVFGNEWTYTEVKVDPFAVIGEITGYRDGEAWWDDQIEAHAGSGEVFEAVGDLMEEVRGSEEPDAFTACREATMRMAIRQADFEGLRTAVIVGAWHVPALRPWDQISIEQDQELLASLNRVPVTASWVPWSYRGLATRSGYRAGVLSPMYYEFCWQTPPENRTSAWLTRMANLMREEGMEVSPASVIEAVRTADMLATVRTRREPGLDEMTDAAIAVMAGGHPGVLDMIADKATIGDKVGSIPPQIEAIPLKRHFFEECKRLRLSPASSRELRLDIRQTLDLERSRFLARLRILGVAWGEKQTDIDQTGTFREEWHLHWSPHLEIMLIQASRWGTQIPDAAEEALCADLNEVTALPALTSRIEQALFADLSEAVARILPRLEHVSAMASDLVELLASITTITRALRIGVTRQTHRGSLADFLERTVVRVSLTLPTAVAGLSEGEGERLANLIVSVVHQIEGLVPDEVTAQWKNTILAVSKQKGIPGFLAGRLARHSGDLQLISAEDQSRAFSRALSPGTPHGWAAAWIHGFLGTSGLALIYSDRLFSQLDQWVTDLAPEVFDQALPLLRRSFGQFPKGERRQLAQRVARGAAVAQDGELDADRLSQVDSALNELFGEIN